MKSSSIQGSGILRRAGRFTQMAGIGLTLLWSAAALAQAPPGGAPAGAGGPPGMMPAPEYWPAGIIKPTVSPIQLPSFALSQLMPPAPPGTKPVANPDPATFDGVWMHRELPQTLIAFDMFGNRVPYTQAARDVINRHITADNAAKPMANASARCFPPGPDWQKDLNFPFRVLRAADVTYLVFEEYHGLWVVHTDPKFQFSGKRFYMGESKGHWDGNTLLVETRNFKQELWLDIFGTPLSTEGKLTHRISKIENGNALEIVTTVEDPKYYEKSWSFARSYAWRPSSWVLGEYNCEAQVADEAGVSKFGVDTGK